MSIDTAFFVTTDKEVHEAFYGKYNGIFRACANSVYQDSPRGEDEAKGERHLHRGSHTMPCPRPYQQICSANHNQAFNTANFRAKGSLTNLSVVDSSKLCANTSRLGLGFILQQKADNDTWALIQAGSHFLIDSESQYAIIFGCPTTLQGHY